MSTSNKITIWQNELLTVKEVAIHLRLSRVTVWRWCQQGIIPASRIGHSWRIHREDLLHFLEQPQPLSLETVNSDLEVGVDSKIQTLSNSLRSADGS